ncbi:MAG: preprotein translocase subunit SecA [Actinomycetota bacterium]
MKLFDKILRAGDGKRLKAVQSVVAPINSLETEMQGLTDEQLRARTTDFKDRLANGADLDDLMVEAFAVVRETATRVIGQRHYDVQMMGGAALHWGSVAEMKTGEGKTLVSTLPVYLNALAGNGVHQITVNDYLATRDFEWMGQIHRFHGLTCGLVIPGNNDNANKKQQYACDITYGTNNEFGFDYLRDNMARSLDNLTQRGHHYAIVDEIDSILIDEARTPLIISGKVRGAADLYYQFANIASRLKRDVDYEVDEEKRIVAITEDGISRVEGFLDIENLYDGVQGDLIHQLNSALKAKELFQRDKDYLVTGDEVKIVDEFTGRVLDGRRWSDGLHQAVEAKEGVKIKDEQQTLATVTLQNYFRLYEKLAGMTGTALADAAELETTYGLAVVQIPTNKPIARMDQPDLIYKTEAAKFGAAIDDMAERAAAGQPVLIGTASVEKSEVLSQLMTKRGLPHEVLNAKANFREADIVAQAGKSGSLTVATNMAGRGVDIVLGGNPEKLAEADTNAEGYDLESDDGQAYYEKRLAHWTPICDEDGDRVRQAGGLYVLATERHESRRIDDQLRGRSGRQGDPGESRFYLSLEDDLMRIFATGAMNWVMDRALPEDVPIESKMVTKSVERAQNTVEQRNAETRKNVLKYDEVYNQQRKVIYQRRLQLLEQGDLREDTVDALDDVAESLIATHCLQELDDTWDLDSLHTELNTFWDTDLKVDQLSEKRSLEELRSAIAEEGLKKYEEREAEIGEPILRQIERQIMLQLIDQRWRDHLTEMAQLREGINLRAMGQRDPLTEWQAEGFDLFSEMVHSLNVDYIRYVMHVEVTTPAAESAQADADGQPSGTATKAPPTGATRAPATTVPTETDITASKGGESEASNGASAAKADAGPAQPFIKDDWDKTPRNAPCPCGSGKKFKQCHGVKR